MHVGKAAGTATEVSMLSCRIAEDEGMWRNIACDHRACPNQGKFAYGHTTEDDRTCTDRRAILHQGRCYLPILDTFELAIRGNSAWKQVVGETDMRANEDTIFQCYTFKDGDMILDFHA